MDDATSQVFNMASRVNPKWVFLVIGMFLGVFINTNIFNVNIIQRRLAVGEFIVSSDIEDNVTSGHVVNLDPEIARNIRNNPEELAVHMAGYKCK